MGARSSSTKKPIYLLIFLQGNAVNGGGAPQVEESEPPPEDCPLRSPKSKRISKLTWKGRTHCLQMLEDALRNNYSKYYAGNTVKIAASDYEPRCCAIDLEYEVFQGSKLANIYKVNVMKKTREIKQCSQSEELHISLYPKMNHGVGLPSSSSEKSEEKDKYPGLVTASQLLSLKMQDREDQGHVSSDLDPLREGEHLSNGIDHSTDPSYSGQGHGYSGQGHDPDDLGSTPTRDENVYSDDDDNTRTSLTNNNAHNSDQSDRNEHNTNSGSNDITKESAPVISKVVPKITYFFERTGVDQNGHNDGEGAEDDTEAPPIVQNRNKRRSIWEEVCTCLIRKVIGFIG